MFKRRIFIFLMLLLMFFPQRGTAVSATIEEKRAALLETADAYYRQGVQLQYDSYRRLHNASPEDATSQHYIYTVCSGFTYQVYYHTFGIVIPDTTEELLDYAEDNKGSEYVLAYYENTDVLGTTSDEVYLDVFDRWLDFLEPGDIFVRTGHAMMIESVDKVGGKVTIIESGLGGRYSYEEHVDVYDDKGTMRRGNLVSRLKAYRGKDYRLALIRPVNSSNQYLKQSVSNGDYKYDIVSYDGITETSKSRLKYNKIDIEKTIQISDGLNQNILANLGDNLTYELTIKNSSDKDYSNFDVVETIDSRLKVIDAGNGILNNNQLKWSFSKLSAGESITIKYTVNVPINNDLLGDIIISVGKVDNIATSKIETLIGNKFTEEDKNKVMASFNKLKSNASNERKFINDIYIDSFGIDLGLTDLDNLDIISYDGNIKVSGGDTLSIKRTKVNETSVKKYIFQNFYGLRLFGGVSTSVNPLRDCPDSSLVRSATHWNFNPTYEFNDRARTITSDMLIDGDIVLLYDADASVAYNSNVCPAEKLENTSYIYLNNKLIRKVSVTEFEEISNEDLTVFLRDMVGKNYVILRPSLGLKNVNVDVGNDEATKDDNKNISNDNKTEEIINPPTGSSLIYLVLGCLVVSVFSFVLLYKKCEYSE